MTYQTYEFTAYSSADLLGGSGTSAGTTFTVPGGASACFSVSDNDAYLSGDSICNEQADDAYGQQASITDGNGNELGNGGQIYAEQYHWVYDSAGNWYLLIEIEQEGGSGDYFSFHNAYGTPPAGETLTFHSSCNIKDGGWNPDYKCLEGGEKPAADLGSVSGRYFIDEDCDGIEDAGEAGLGGMEVKLRDADTGAIVATTTTDANGNYTFENVEAGNYCVVFEKASGYTPTARDVGSNDAIDSDLKSNWESHIFTVDAGENETDIDAGVKEQPGWIKGRLTFDADCDNTEWNTQTGTWDEGVAGQTVELLDLNGNVVATSVTDSYGNYMFDVAPGEYRVKFPELAGYEFSEKDQGGVEHKDSDADANGLTDVITVGAGQTVANIDAGIKEDAGTGSISGTVWCDEDCDGIQDSDGGKGANLLSDGDFELGSTQYNIGQYGQWYDAGNGKGDIVYGSAQNHNGNAADNGIWELDEGSILCQVFDAPEAGTYCLTFDVYDNACLTDADDRFQVKINGQTVEVVTVTADGQVQIELQLGAGQNRLDFVSLSTAGYGSGLDNIEIRQVEAGGSTGTGPNLLSDSDFEAGATHYNIGQYGAWYDAGNDKGDIVQGDAQGHKGNAADNEIFELDQGSILCQEFNAPEAGTYTLTLDVYDNCNIGASDDTFVIKINGQTVETVSVTADGQLEIELQLGAGQNRIDFVSKSTVSGYGPGLDNIEIRQVIDNPGTSEPTKSGVEIKLIDASGAVIATTFTDADGNYEFADVPVGEYTIMGVAPNGTEFTIQDAGSDDSVDSDVDANGMSGTITVTKDGNVDVDLGVCEKAPDLGAISGRYFCDENGNNVDDGEVGIVGATVWLLQNGAVIANTTTGANGEYSFGDLEAGDYAVRFEDPNDIGQDGKVFVEANQGGDEANDSDVESVGGAGNGNTGTVTVIAGETTTDVDAGIKDPETAAIEGQVFCDDNGNDVRDAGDTPIGGVTVELLDDSGAVVRTTTTDTDGTYEFTGLAAGDYQVRFPTSVDGKVLVDANDPNGNGDDSNDSDADQGTGTTGTISVGIGETSSNNDAGVEDPAGAEIRGRYFCDENDNDVDDGEPGIANAEVVLYDAAGNEAGRTTTDGNGNYAFTALAAGTYSVVFAADAAGKTFVDQNDPNGNGDETNDSDADANGVITGITVGVNEVSDNNDAGVEDPGTASLAGRVFCDENDNSLDDGEAGVGGVEVALFKADGTFVAVVDTNPDGSYIFTGLDAGDYFVDFAEGDADLEGKVLVTQNVDGNANDVDDSDAAIGTGTTDTIMVGIGEAVTDVDAGVEDPGTASVGDTVFIDANGNGVRDPGEAGLDGVEVKLLADLDGDGQVDDVVDTTTTTNGGQYLFDGLDAGEYAIMFTNPNGYDFTTEGAGPADATNDDSDAGANGMTDTFVLSIGEDERDIDAGVVLQNGAPTPADDAAETCADEAATVDVLANDSDPENDPLSITAVDGQAISEGQTITTSAGTQVTLSGGNLVVNGAAAYAGLNIGETAVESISYTVSDGSASADAALDMTFCGDANDYGSLSASLPATTDFVVEGALADADAFSITLSGSGDARFDGDVFENAYCLSFYAPIPLNQTVAGDVSGTDEAAATGVFSATQVSGFNGETAADNLDLIQYIVAQNYEGNGTYDGWDVQFAIWELTDNINTEDWTGTFTQATAANVDAILADAAANGEGFSFGGDGDQVGMIIDPNPKTAGVIEQPFIVGFMFDDYDCLC